MNVLLCPDTAQNILRYAPIKFFATYCLLCRACNDNITSGRIPLYSIMRGSDLARYLYNLIKNGKINRLPAIIGRDVDEASLAKIPMRNRRMIFLYEPILRWFNAKNKYVSRKYCIAKKAVKYGYMEVFCLLYDDILGDSGDNKYNRRMRKIAIIAAKYDRVQFLETLAQKGIRLNLQISIEACGTAVKYDNVRVLAWMVENSYIRNDDPQGLMPDFLKKQNYVALNNESFHCIKYLCETFNRGIARLTQESLLCEAASIGKIWFCKWVYEKFNYGHCRSDLTYTLYSKGHKDVLLWLSRRGVNIEINSPIFEAMIERNDSELIKAINPDIQHALKMAIRANSLNIAKWALPKYKIGHCELDHETARALMTESGNEVFKLFIENGFEPPILGHFTDRGYNSESGREIKIGEIIQCAVENKNIALIKYLYSHGYGTNYSGYIKERLGDIG